MSFNRALIAAVLGPELARWKARGRTPVFWWRDDDARRPTLALERLLALSTRHHAPLTLAAVPDGDIQALAQLCRSADGIELAIHGFRHENRAAPGQPSGEVNDLDRVDDVVVELGTALDVFRRAGVVASLFVPPWNNAHPTLKTALALRRLDLSCYGATRGQDDPARLDAHLDVMRWKPRPRFRGAWRFLQRARRLLAERRCEELWDEPLGLLTHHLDHDEAAWRFLEDLLAAVAPFTSRRAFAASRTPRAMLASGPNAS